MKLIEFLSTHSVNYALINGYLTMLLIAAIACIIWQYLRLKEAKISLKKSAFYKYVSADTIDSYESQIKLQECEIAERKKYFEDAIVEITKLTSQAKISEDELKIAYERIESLTEVNNMLLKSGYETRLLIKKNRDQNNELITYWKERALHYKHTKKVVQSEWYECLSNKYAPDYLIGILYRQKETKLNLGSNLICLIQENGISDILEKRYFKPVTK